MALNVAARNFTALTLPLDHDQVVPVPFLWAQRLAIAVGGVNELALRAVPLLVGIATVVVIARLARRVLGPSGALLATSMAALSPMLVLYSNEAKPYVVDAFAAAMVLWCALIAGEKRDTHADIRLCLAGLTAVLFSFTSILLLAAVVPSLLMSPSYRRRPASLWLAGGAAALAALFGAMYARWYRVHSESEYLQRFWAEAFFSPWQEGAGRRASSLLADYVGNVFLSRRYPAVLALSATAVLLSAGILGARRIGQARGWWIAGLAAGPFVAAVGASVLGVYPFASRLDLFAVPGMLLLVAAGVSGTVERLTDPTRTAAWICMVAWLILPAFVQSLDPTIRAVTAEELKPLVSVFMQRHQPDDPVYLHASAVPAWTFYTTNWSDPDSSRLRRLAYLDDARNPAFENRPPRRDSVLRAEAHSLQFESHDWTEIVGLPSGMEFRYGVGTTQTQPDVGWADVEAERIRAAATPDIWVCFAHVSQGFQAERQLLAAIERLGARRIGGWQSYGAALLAYRFPDRTVIQPSKPSPSLLRKRAQ